MCNSCNFSSNSWSGFSTHTDNNGIIYPFTIIYTHHRTSNTSTTTNPCDPNGNIGIINDSVVKTPCESLANYSNNANYKAKFNNLNKPEKFTAPQETGFALVPNTVGGHYNKDLLASGNKALKPPSDAINFTHVHNIHMKLDSISGQTFDHGVKMLSPADIEIMSGDMLNNNTANGTFAPSDTFAVMISNEGIFAVVATDTYIPILKVDYDNFYNNYYEKAKDIIIKNRHIYNTAEKRKKALEKMMLQLINGTPGYKGKLELFEGDATEPNNIKWTKKSLNTNDSNIVDQTPC